MSTYYGYHCRTCGRSSDHWLNRGDTALQEALDAWPTIIKPAFDLAARIGVSTEGAAWAMDVPHV